MHLFAASQAATIVGVGGLFRGFSSDSVSTPCGQSGVGALGPNVMYIFSSYAAFLGDGGTAGPWDYEIYVQAFDPKGILNPGKVF